MTEVDAPARRGGVKARLANAQARLRAFATSEHNGAGLAAFRTMFGLLCLFSVVRFALKGWVERYFVMPTHFFHFWGFDWIEPWGRTGVYLHLGLLSLLALGITFGYRTRLSAGLFFLAFTAFELFDVTNYLNHYYLVSLLALLLAVVPTGATVPGWAYGILRFQVGAVYFFAGLAKATPDWLMHGQPLEIWLRARTDFPLLGPLFDEPGVALGMSWAGFLHDILIVPLLLWKPTRRYAYCGLVCFHVITGLLLPIGLFPIIMMTAATIFFSPDWPRRALAAVRRTLRRPEETRREEPVASRRRLFHPAIARLGWAALAGYVVLQTVMPLRAHLYGGNVLWHEQGMRWSWRVVVREKNGDVSYRVRTRDSQREIGVSPRRYLSTLQAAEMSSQPDLILQLAHIIADDYQARLGEPVEVRADAWVSLNGRRPQRLIDPDVDLARTPDGLAPAAWILPGPDTPPAHLQRRPLFARR